jgi:2-polyprenyl-3-methyl-5-hydroxy-6-metoxy-1,4-benzoquinol methylase
MATSNYKKHTSKNPLKRFYINNFFKVVFDFIQNLKIESVLDVGCGEGFVLKKIKEQNIGTQFKGVDASKKAVSLGRRENPDLDIQTGDIYDLKFEDKSFDLVMCIEVLEHLKCPEKAIKELKRVSKKYILFSVPNEPWFTFLNYTQWGKDIGHINKWTSGKFIEFIKSRELKILKIRTPFPWTLVLCKKN